MDFTVLGPVTARRDGRPLPVGSGRERFVLASLLLNADRPTSADELVDRLWSDPPRSARAQLHNMVSNLRRRLDDAAAELIVTRPVGYELRLDGHRLDVLDFRRLVAAARQVGLDGDPTVSGALLSQALALWRGPALADVPHELAAGARNELRQERLAAIEANLDAELAGGRYADLLAGLAEPLEEEPYRERFWALRMVALAALGRRAEALETYERVRGLLMAELGVEPGPELRDLDRQIRCGATAGFAAAPRLVLPRQLPPAVPIAGRDKLLGEIGAELAGPGAVVVLVGPGGVGKTSLAVAAAHRAGDAYPDGQLYADLRGSRNAIDPEYVAARFLRALGVEDARIPTDPDERCALYRSHLAGRRVLVVLDDAGAEDQVRPLLPGDGRCGVVVTSRRRLDALVGGARWTVPVLEDEAALQVLTRIAGGRRVAVEPDAAAHVVRLCGRLPLALSVAAARLAAHPDWTLDELATRLGRERRRLDELAVGDLDVRATIALSYRSLGSVERRLFRRLGLVPALDWPAWVAAELHDGPPGEADRLLDALCAIHLVESRGRDVVGQPRFRMHDLVAAYAAERAHDEEPECDRDAAVDRMLAGWLALAAAADDRAEYGLLAADDAAAPAVPRLADLEPIDLHPRQWLDAERPSLVAAVAQARRTGAARLAAQLALRLSGHLAACPDWPAVLDAVTADVRRSGADDLLSRLLTARFAVEARRSESATLIAIADEQLAVAHRIGDRKLATEALTNAGWAARKDGRLAEARDRLEQSLATCDTATPPVVRTRALHGLVLVHREAGHPERAVGLAEEAVAVQRQRGGRRTTAISLVNYAATLVDVGRSDDARRVIDEVDALTRDAPELLTMVDVEQIRAEIDLRAGRWAAVDRRLRPVLESAEKNTDGAGAFDALRGLGEAALGQGRFTAAIATFRQALQIGQRLTSPLEAARAHARLDLAHTSAGEAEAAADARWAWRAILAERNLDVACLRLYWKGARPPGGD